MRRESKKQHSAVRPADPFIRLEPLKVSTGRAWVVGALLTFLGAVVLQQIGIWILAALLGVTSQVSSASHANTGAWWLTVGGVLGLWPGFALGVFFVVKRTTNNPLRQAIGLSFRPIDLIGVPLGVAFQFGLTGLTNLLFHPRDQGSTERWLNHLHGGSLVLIAVSLCLLVPVLEEALFRGLLGRGLFSLFPPGSVAMPIVATLVMLFDGLIFGAAHGDATAFLALALLGALLQFEHLQTGRLGLSIVTHATFNIVAVVPVVLWGSS